MPVPSTPLLDDFNRADAANLGGNYGENIFSSWPTMQIVSNSARNVAAFRSNYWNTLLGPDHEAWMTVVTLNPNQIKLWCRLQNPGQANVTGYTITVGGSGDWYLERNFAGTTVLQTLGGVGNFVAGTKIALQCIGTTLRAYKDTGGGWTQVGTDVKDALLQGPGYIGFMCANNTVGELDDFGGGTLDRPTSFDFSKLPIDLRKARMIA